MSRWQKHMTQSPDSQELVGEQVDCMNIIRQGSDGNTLKLECSKCDMQFWFEDRVGGKNAVQRDGETHAKCPRCGCEWDGDIQHYYGVGFMAPPPSIITQLTKLLSPDHPLSHDAGTQMMSFALFDAVAADTPFEAIKKAVVPSDILPQMRQHGVAALSMPRSVFEEFHRHRGVETQHPRFRQEATVPATDGAAKKVMDTLN